MLVIVICQQTLSTTVDEVSEILSSSTQCGVFREIVIDEVVVFSVRERMDDSRDIGG